MLLEDIQINSVEVGQFVAEMASIFHFSLYMLRSSPFHSYSGFEVALINMMEADVTEGDFKVQSHWVFPLLLLLGPLLHVYTPGLAC